MFTFFLWLKCSFFPWCSCFFTEQMQRTYSMNLCGPLGNNFLLNISICCMYRWSNDMVCVACSSGLWMTQISGITELALRSKKGHGPLVLIAWLFKSASLEYLMCMYHPPTKIHYPLGFNVDISTCLNEQKTTWQRGQRWNHPIWTHNQNPYSSYYVVAVQSRATNRMNRAPWTPDDPSMLCGSRGYCINVYSSHR